MKTAAVIAEFNPFHNGHAEIMRAAKELTGCDHVIVLMSGDYVQRGVPAILDRHTRCRAALEGGADLVLAMPTRYCTSSAENYALLSIRLLNALHVVDYLVFGSECGSIDELHSCARFLSSETSGFQEELRRFQREGMSFPRSRALAAPVYAGILSQPNNILGVEYIKALLGTASDIEPVTVRRIGPGHNDQTSVEKYASASAVRAVIEENVRSSRFLSTDMENISTEDNICFRCIQELSDAIPEKCLRTQILSVGTEGIVTDEDFSLILAEKIWGAASPATLTAYQDVSEDLAAAIFNNRSACTSFGSFADILKNKSITRTHINRALLHIALGIRKREDTPLFAHILGCRENARGLLGALAKQSAVPVITRPSKDLFGLTGPELEIFEEEIRVSNLYNAVRAVKKKATVQNTLSRKFIKV